MSAATGFDFRSTLIRVDTISGGGGHGRHPDIEQLELVSPPGLAMIEYDIDSPGLMIDRCVW